MLLVLLQGNLAAPIYHKICIYPWIIKNVWLVVFDLEAIGLIDS